MRFEVKVSSYGDRWLISAPAFGVRKIVDEESAIRNEAHRMIARCGTAPAVFEVDLVPNEGPERSARDGDLLRPVEINGHGRFPHGASVTELHTGTRRTDESVIDDGL